MTRLNKYNSLILCSLVAFFILLSDRVSKFIIVQSLRFGESLEVTSFFNIVRVENKGVTFGLLSGAAQPYVFAAVSLVVAALLCVWAKKDKLIRLPASLIIGGAIGNIVDRIINGAVIDFLDFHLLAYHWPAFNIADSAIVIGTAVLFFISYGEERK
ncbi:MAG: signal peptidase II [Holosporaceae bacterium]|jgi:signal peptidase II|nr:signal peptidase II [Holosporaceae bacterium]